MGFPVWIRCGALECVIEQQNLSDGAIKMCISLVSQALWSSHSWARYTRISEANTDPFFQWPHQGKVHFAVVTPFKIPFQLLDLHPTHLYIVSGLHNELILGVVTQIGIHVKDSQHAKVSPC